MATKTINKMQGEGGAYLQLDDVSGEAVLSLDGQQVARGTKLISVTADATLSLTAASHLGKKIIANKADGIIFTLPAATGTGDEYEVLVGTTITSNALTVKVSDASHIMAGHAILLQDGGDTNVAFETAADTDTVSANGSTTGGIKGARWKFTDIGSNLWHVEVIGSATGTEATPFSATVS